MNVIILLCCLSSFNTSHVTFEWDHVPGSINIKYTGIRKVIIRETIDFLSSEWSSRASLLYNGGEITYKQYTSSLNHLSRTIVDGRSSGLWWERDWWHSLPPDKGGIHNRRHYVVGRTGDFIDIGIAHLNQDFKFKLKEYKKNITHNWKFKFRPRVKFSSSKWIREATVAFSLTYSRKRVRRFRFILITGYKQSIREFVQLTVEMLNL